MDRHLAAVFRTLARPAAYTPGEGDAVACKAMPMGGGEVFTVGKVEFTAERPLFHVRRSEVTPAVGGTLTVDGTAHPVQAVEPAPQDPRGLLWQVVPAWGVAITWTVPGGGGGGSEGPDPALTYTAAATPAGSGTLTILASGWTTGKVSAGDTIEVDGGSYTAGADVELSLVGMSYGFADVPIAPTLAGTLAGGEAVMFTAASPSTDLSIRAAVADYTAEEIMGGVLAGDRRIVIRAADFTGTPSTSDTVTWDGETWAVVHVSALYAGADVAAWTVQLRR